MVQPSAGITFSGNAERLCQQSCVCLFRKNILGSGPAGTLGCNSNDELACPVPRLTLLFFGAAKDVPEAARMVPGKPAFLPT
jgi:hypothetical protein